MDGKIHRRPTPTAMPDDAPPSISCAIYTRQSRESDSDFTSSQAQFEACLDFVSARRGAGWVWNDRRYDDEGESGKRRDRPGLTQLLADIEAATIDRVIVHRLDRLSRSLFQSVAILQELRDHHVGISIVLAPELGCSAEDSLILNILSTFAEFEHDMIRDRMSDARLAHKLRGRRVAGVVLLGYAADPLTKQLVVVAEEAQQVRKIFEMAAEGKTPTQIATLVNQLGWRTKERVSRRSGKTSGGNPWTPRQILATLSNPVYRSLVRLGSRTVPGQHEAIVTEDLWNRAHAQVAARRVSPSGPRQRFSYTPLRGLLICGRCGRKMSLHQSRRGKFLRIYYRCRSTAGGRPPCTGVCISAVEIAGFVVQLLRLPQTYSHAQLMGDGDSELMNEFCSRWFKIDSFDQGKLLSQVLEKVVYDPDRERVEVAFDRAKVRKFLERAADEPAGTSTPLEAKRRRTS
jgi:site-specific DNA recombinase